MQKLTSILAVLDQPAVAVSVLRKAADLARQFDARLEILAIEPMRAARVTPQCAALGHPDITVREVSRLGRRIDSLVLEQVHERNPDFVIKARAGVNAVRRCSLTTNDWRLSQECPVPLMLVTARPWAQPARFAAAVDVSDHDTLEAARAVIHAAGFVALGCHGNLDILYTERELHDERVRMERAVKLAQLVREFHVGCERLQMFDGVPEKRLPPLVSARQYDVLVLGAVTHRTGLVDAIYPLTSRLVEATSRDVLLVKAPGGEVRDLRPLPSICEQASHQRQQLV